MFENLIATDKTTQTENLINQVVKILAGKGSNPATLKFISQLQTGKIFDAVFTGNTPGGKGVLSLEGNKVVVELPKAIPFEGDHEQSTRVPLIKGQAIRVRVESSGAGPALKIISRPLLRDQPDNQETRTNLTSRGRLISRLPRFEEFPQTSESPRRSINARITQILDSKSILVNTGSRNIVVPVENTEILKTGAQVNISFEKTEKGQRAILVDISADSPRKIDFNTLKPYLPARMPIAKMAQLLIDEILESPVMQELKIKMDVVTRLGETLHLLVPREGEIPSEKQVRQQVESSGVNYEAKVRHALELGLPVHKELATDLKGLLLEIHQTAEKVFARQSNKATSPFAEFRQTIKFAIDNIELNQLSSQMSKQENQPLVIQIPNPLSSGNKTIHLYVRSDSSDKEAKDKKSNHNVAFFLDLSFLGKIKINSQIGPENLSVRIDTENEDIANFINDRANDFKKKMGHNDIETSVECCVSSKVKPAKDSLIELLVSQNTSLVNIKT